ncbi:MAG: hypothetical protein Q4F75_04165 [Pseudomonadota bacterium]|nr:hypothetical protein [Pseudomonadota bacterium]
MSQQVNDDIFNKRVYGEDIDSQSTWLTKNLYKLMIWISIIWFAVVLIYITQFFGWSNLFLMMPDEFGGFMAGITLPLAIIWVVMAYIDRGTSFKNEARFLRAYMNQLVYPEDGGAQTAKAMADAIRSQVVELQEATRQATEQTEKIRDELGGRVEDFSKIVSVLDNYSSRTVGELARTVKELAGNLDSINERTLNSTENFRACVTNLSSSYAELQKDTENLLVKIAPKVNDVRATSVVLKSTSEETYSSLLKANELIREMSEKSTDNISRASEMLNAQIEQIEQSTARAVDRCKDMGQDLEKNIALVDGVMTEQNRHLLDNVKILEQGGDVIRQKLSEHGALISSEVDRIMTKTHAIEESIALQVRELSGVSEDVYSSMLNAESNIKEQADKLQRTSEIAVANINTVVGTLTQEASTVAELADKSIIKTTAMTDDLLAKQNTLDAVSAAIVNNIKNLSQELQDRTEQVKLETTTAVEQFNAVSAAMKKNADNLSEASSVVIAQSKVSEAALAQQQRHISGSVSHIEEIKGELKREMDELMRAASLMNENALGAVSGLKEQMEQALAASESVVERTRSLNSELHNQSESFVKSTDNTVEKIVGLNTLLDKNCQRLDSFSHDIEVRTSNIMSAVNKQVDLIDRSTASSEKTHNEILNKFSQQSQMFNTVAEETVSFVSDVVKALDEKAETVSMLFKHQENEFFNICDRISENTNTIGGSLKKQVAVIEQSADRVFSRLAMLEEDANKRSQAISDNTDKSIEKLALLNQAVGEQNKEISEYIEGINDKLGAVSDNFNSHITGLNNAMDGIRHGADEVVSAIVNNCSQLNEANDNLSTRGQSISGVMESHVKNLDAALVKAKTQADMISETLAGQVESLSDIVNVVSTQTRLGEASLAQQYKYLSDASSDIAKRMTEINEQFKGNADLVSDNANKLSYEFDVIGDKLIKLSEEVTKSSKNSVKNLEQVGMSLSQASDDLNAAIASSGQKINGIINDYQKNVAGFNTVTAEASSGVVEINNLIAQQSDKMLQLSDGTKELVAYFNTVLNDTSIQLSDRANHAYDKVKGLGESLKKLSIQLEDTTKQSSHNMEDAGNKLRASLSEAAANAERISNDIRTSGDVFLKQTNVLTAASTDTIDKVNTAISGLLDVTHNFTSRGDDILQKANGFNSLFKKQLETLIDTSTKADIKIKDLNKVYEGIRVDVFLRNASYILEKLEAAAVDISRIFSPDVEEDLWKKYYNGDTAVFVRHLAKSLSRSQIIAVKNEFEKNLEFRDIVTRYLSDFESLVNKARDSENSGMLLSVISGADVGKLYYVLAKSLDRIN